MKKHLLFVVLIVALVGCLAGTAFAGDFVFQSDLGGNNEFVEGVQRTIYISAVNAGPAIPAGRYKFTISNEDGSPVVPADAAVQYQVNDTTTFLALPMVVSGNDVVGYFGPAGGFPMPMDFSAVTQFRVTFAAGTAGDVYKMKLEVVDGADAVIVAAGAGVFTEKVMAAGYLGTSEWSYRDLHDTALKYEGGYAAFDDAATGMYDAAPGVNDVGPHGGYNTTTNKCKVCHAVHRAEGAYYLLRADSQDDACTYCHVGSAHSTRVVYDLNPDGIYTMNGHTIGAQTQIPDSTVLQTAEAVTLSTTDSNGDPLTETIHVRRYDEAKNEMYRFARHHGQSAATFVAPAGTATDSEGNAYNTFAGGTNGGSRSGYVKVGPLALRCMSCHQPHNATNEVWRPRAFPDLQVAQTGGAPGFSVWSGTSTADNYGDKMAPGGFLSSGYKLLRRSPAGSTVGSGWAPAAGDPENFYGVNQIVKVIEASATAGVNFSQHRSAQTTYTENGVQRAQPLWIAQDIHHSDSGHGTYRYASTVNQAALSWWCADCHNLNIGGWEPLSDPELGFKSHTERTHPAPFYGAYTGPGQCYSCHRNDLAPQMGLADAANPIGGATPAAITPGRESCTQCHYGTGDYYKERVDSDVNSANGYTPAVNSDFPHSGAPTDIKMLGSYSVANTNVTGGWTPRYDAATVDADSLDQVCLRCHPGIGVNH